MSYSSKLSAHYLDLAKASVSKENFAGEDVRFSSEYESLESELAKASSMHESGQIDWLKIRENSENLLRTQSKDLRVGACVTSATPSIFRWRKGSVSNPPRVPLRVTSLQGRPTSPRRR